MKLVNYTLWHNYIYCRTHMVLYMFSLCFCALLICVRIASELRRPKTVHGSIKEAPPPRGGRPQKEDKLDRYSWILSFFNGSGLRFRLLYIIVTSYMIIDSKIQNSHDNGQFSELGAYYNVLYTFSLLIDVYFLY